MAHCTDVPESNPQYTPPINYTSDLFGSQPSLNTEYNCEVQGGQYPYAEQDHLALRHLAFKNFVRPRTLDGKTVFKPVNEEEYSCECSLSRTPFTSKYNNETLKFEVKSGVLKRSCDCIKRNGLQDRCPRVRHENRWECLMGLPHGCTSGPAKPRPLYANHLHRPTRPPYSNPCVSSSNLQGGNCVPTSYGQNRPRCVRSQIVTSPGCSPGVKRSSCGPTDMARMRQKSSPCLPKNNKSLNIDCVCQTC